MSSLTHKALVDALTALAARKGAELFEIRKYPVLLGLACVRNRAASDDILILERTFAETLASVCQQVVPIERCNAALGFFGLLAGTRGQNLTRRRTYAGGVLGYQGDKTWDAFRNRYEKDLIRDVAAQLYLHEFDFLKRQPVSVVPGESDSPPPQAESRAGVLEEARGYALIGYGLTYHVRSHDYRSHGHSREFEIEAVRPAPNPFKHWYKWSGTGIQHEPVVVSSQHQAMSHLLPGPDGLTYYYVRLDRLRVGQRTTVMLEQEFYDSGKTFQSVVSTRNPDAGLEWLRLQAILPLERPPSRVTYTCRNPRRDGEEIVFSKEGKVRIDEELGAVLLQWSPTELRYDHRYSLQWQYDDGHSIYPPGY